MIVVTGGAGFIGSALVSRLNLSGYEDILVCDLLGHDHRWKNLCNTRFADYIHRDDLFSNLQALGEEISFVFHMGACSSTTETDVDYLMENNFEYSKKIFDFCTSKRIPLIYASSGATYGNTDRPSSDNDLGNLKPLNGYGWSKEIFDRWVLQQQEKPPFWAGLKFFNVYGPNEYHKSSQASFVYHAFNQIMQSGKVQLFKSHRDGIADGHQSRDFVYVKDVCDVMVAFMKRERSDAFFQSGIYNLGTGKSETFLKLVECVFAALGRDVAIDFVDTPENIRNQYQYYTCAEMEKLNSALSGAVRFHNLEEGILDYVRNYLMRDYAHL